MSAIIREEYTDTQVNEFNVDTIRQLPYASEYIKALTQYGPAKYIDNAHVEMKAVSIDNIVLPIVISSPRYGNSDVCSPYSHYVQYTLEELIKRNKKIPKWLFKILVGSFGSVLKMCGIDHVVYINNHLFATNPHQPFSSQQLSRITAYLKKRYPEHTIVHRTINPHLHKNYFDALQENGFTMVKSRKVFLLNPESERFRNSTNAKLDLRLLKRSPYDVIDNENISDADIPRLVELYRSLYLDKHCYLNPQLNVPFFSLTIRKNILMYRVLKRDGRIDAFISYFICDGVLTGAFVGYDRNLPQKLGLYRQLIALLICESKERGLMLNLSAGVGAFKELRGAFPVVDYDAVHNRHLSWRKRLAWYLVRMEGGAWSLGL